MKHADAATLARLGRLLAALRADKRLQERRPGVFYAKSKALLHFHEDPAGIFADLKRDGDWARFAVNTAADEKRLLASLADGLDGK